jgi:hypothetical protein
VGRLILAAALAGLLLVPASAAASKRYTGCVAESHGCMHRFVGGDLPVLLFKDRRGANTAYRVCVRDPVHRVCAVRRTGKAGKWHQGGTWNIGAVGKHIVRWYVNGFQVARWKFRVVPEGD